MEKTRRQWAVLAGFILLCLSVAAIGGLSTRTSVGTWYVTLNKPSWTPPSWAFGPVWTVLYLMMAVSGWLVWRSPESRARSRALAIYGVQLGLNLAWSFLFFGLRSPALGALDITLLWLAIGAFVSSAWPVSRSASYLFLPYWVWVTYASTLNYSISWLN